MSENRMVLPYADDEPLPWADDLDDEPTDDELARYREDCEAAVADDLVKEIAGIAEIPAMLRRQAD